MNELPTPTTYLAVIHFGPFALAMAGSDMRQTMERLVEDTVRQLGGPDSVKQDAPLCVVLFDASHSPPPYEVEDDGVRSPKGMLPVLGAYTVKPFDTPLSFRPLAAM